MVRDMKTSIRTHERRVALVTGAIRGIGPSVIAGGRFRSRGRRTGRRVFEYAHTPGTIGCLPRVVRHWGRQPME